jgi:hypothetical protein
MLMTSVLAMRQNKKGMRHFHNLLSSSVLSSQANGRE